MKTTILKYVLLTAKILGAITVIVSASFGVYKFFEKKVVEDYKGKNDIEIIKHAQIENSKKTDSILVILVMQNGKLNQVIEKQEDYKEGFNALRDVVLDIAEINSSIKEIREYTEKVPVLKKNLMPEVQTEIKKIK
jgi:predicted SpoU family rRNA methylase